MANYLIVDRNHEIPTVTLVEADSLKVAVESLELADGESVEVFRVAAPARTVRVKTETIRKLEVG